MSKACAGRCVCGTHRREDWKADLALAPRTGRCRTRLSSCRLPRFSSLHSPLRPTLLLPRSLYTPLDLLRPRRRGDALLLLVLRPLVLVVLEYVMRILSPNPSAMTRALRTYSAHRLSSTCRCASSSVIRDMRATRTKCSNLSKKAPVSCGWNDAWPAACLGSARACARESCRRTCSSLCPFVSCPVLELVLRVPGYLLSII